MAKRTRIQHANPNTLGEYKKLESLMARAKGSASKPKTGSGRMPKAKKQKTKSKTSKPADVGRNARKRYQRTIARLEQAKQDTYSPDLKAQYERQIEEVQRAIASTYAPKGGWKTKEQKAQFEEGIKRGDKITEFTKRELGNAQRLRNFNFQQQIKWASSENKRALAYITPEEVKAFYNVTQKIWDRPEIPPEKRNQAIMDYFKTKDLEVAFNRAMSLPGVAEKVGKEIVKRTLTEFDYKDLNEQQIEFMHEEGIEPGQQTDEGSPTWAMTLPEFDPDKDWSDYLDGEGEE